jgi:hypothetical protein
MVRCAEANRGITYSSAFPLRPLRLRGETALLLSVLDIIEPIDNE